MKCPGQDSRYWDLNSIFEVPCPVCRNNVEFFKDDIKRRCPNCGNALFNPKLDLGCAKNCPSAEFCVGDRILGVSGK